MENNKTPAQILSAAAFLLGATAATMDEYTEECGVYLLLFDEQTRDTSVMLIDIDDADAMVEEIAGAIRLGKRPISIEVNDSEAHDFRNLALEYIADVPSVEDLAIVQGCLVMDEPTS